MGLGVLILFLLFRGVIADELFSWTVRLRFNSITDNAYQETAFIFRRPWL